MVSFCWLDQVHGFLAIFHGCCQYFCVLGCYWWSFKEDDSHCCRNRNSPHGWKWTNQVKFIWHFLLLKKKFGWGFQVIEPFGWALTWSIFTGPRTLFLSWLLGLWDWSLGSSLSSLLIIGGSPFQQNFVWTCSTGRWISCSKNLDLKFQTKLKADISFFIYDHTLRFSLHNVWSL